MMPLPIHGSVDDAHTILGVEEAYFLPDFKEYIRKEQLNWSRIEGQHQDIIGWVFWSQLDNFADLIRIALQKLISKVELWDSLVQFWAATKTSEGRTLLTTQFQPFALGPTSKLFFARHMLCSYRMVMCREYNNSFYADAECAQELLGLPGRVFLNQLPESTPHVKYYTLKEYPQRDLALNCFIGPSWAVPVFEHSSHTCIGVLEIVSLYDQDIQYCHDKVFQGRMYDSIFQEFGLRCFEGYEHCKMQYWDKNEGLTDAFQELKMVCKIHKLPLALAWVSCHSCNDLLQSQFQFSVLDCSADEEDDNEEDDEEDDDDWYDNINDDWYANLDAFVNVSKVCLLRKGHITGRILPLHDLLYCSDVKQFSIAEFPLVPYARWCKLGGWFTMCLQSGYTGDELYVLEFFLPKSNKNNENILTKLRLILGTMEKYFKTFKLASGQGLGEALSLEVIDFQNGQKSRSIQIIPATRCVPGLEPLQDGGVMLQLGQVEQPSMDVINSGMNVVSEAQNYNLPILDSLQNGKVTKQAQNYNFTPNFKMMKMPIPIDGSVDDAHTILGVRENYFTRDFKEYIQKEQLYWSRLDGYDFFGVPSFGLVFWSQLDTDNFAELIRNALQKLISKEKLWNSLVQFWAATKTSEGRTLLTTQFQPFALATTYDDTDWRKGLCEYRMGMCREYNNSFYADAECAQELLGLPGRVFLNQLPESTPHVKLYTLKEYPQRDLALRCEIESSWAVPVFDHSSHTCVGVLEIVSLRFLPPVLHRNYFSSQIYDIFQEVGLQCLTGAIHSGTNVVSEDQNYISPSLEVVQNGEVTMQLDSSHQPPLDPPNNGQHVVIAERNISTVTSLEERKRKTQRVDKGTGVRIELSLEDILKCAKMSRADAAEKLQVSVSTLKRVCRGYGMDRWAPHNIEKFRSFRPSPVENEGQTQQHLNSNLPSNQGLDCVTHTKPAFHDLPSNQASDSVAHTKPAFQDVDIVTITAKYENNTIKFQLSLPPGLEALQQEVAKRLNLEAGTYYIRYEDEEKELILIACDQDLQDCIDTFKSLGKTSVVVQLEPK